MANVSLMEILQPQYILRVISKVRAGTGPMGRWLGFHPSLYTPDSQAALSGPNTISGPLRYVSWRIDNDTRTIMQFRTPGTGPATVPPNPIGQVPLACARFHEKVQLQYESLSNMSSVVGPNSVIDQQGQDYIGRQTRKIARKGNNAIELMAAGMMRGQFYINFTSGDRMYVSLTQPAGNQNYNISFQIPAGNTGTLNPLGTGSIFNVPITNPACPFISYTQTIKAQFAQLTGYAMTDVWCNSIRWADIVTNNQVRQTAGTSETPFSQFDREPVASNYDGLPVNDYVNKLRGDPTIMFHVSDDGLITGADIDPIVSSAPATPVALFDKIIPDNLMIFTTQPAGEWAQLYQGGESVVEYPGGPATNRQGWYAWSEPQTQPATLELLGLLNAVPVMYNPLVSWPCQVV